MSNFSTKLEHLLSSRAEIIARMQKLPPAEGDDTEKLTGQARRDSAIKDVPPENCVAWPDEKSAPVSVILPPLETFMDVPENIRKNHFFSTAKKGEILTGFVSAMQDSGLVITILSYDCGPRRDFGGLKITGFCPVRQIPRLNGNPLDTFQINDRVRAYIIDVHLPHRLILSMNPKTYNRDLYGEVRFGVIAEEELPLHYKKTQSLDNKSFEECLETTPQFHNPDGINVLCKRFGIPRSSVCSLLQPYATMSLPKSEMAVELRRQQLRTLSMKHVAQGVKYYKDGRQTEALQCYNFAIEIEDSNPDAYVAKGALYASNSNWPKAIEDFERALSLKPNHTNARNYLGQTLVACANEIQDKDSIKAQKMLKRAINLDRNNQDARTLLKHISGTDQLSDEENIESDPGEIKKRDRNVREWSRSLSRSPRHGERKDRRMTPPSPVAANRSRSAQKRSRSPNRSPQEGQTKEFGRKLRLQEPMEVREEVAVKYQQQNQRRVFSPPKNVRKTEDGAMTKYDNVNNLPTSSKVLQERLQAQLAAIERRHGGAADPGGDAEDRSPSPGGLAQHPPRQNLWVPPSQYNNHRGGGGGRHQGDYRDRRPEWHRGGRGRFQPRGRWSPRRSRSPSDRRDRSPSPYRRRPFGGHRGGGRGRFERRGGYNNRGGGGGGGGGGGQHGRRQYNKRSGSRSGSSGRSSSRSGSRDRDDSKTSRKRSSSRSPSSPPRKTGKKANVSRAVLNLPDLAPLEKSSRLVAGDENLADLDTFVAQLKAKRQHPESRNDASPMMGSPLMGDQIKLE